MCTYIGHTVSVSGAGKGAGGWFRLTEAVVGYDHPSHANDDHAILIDFTNQAAGPSARVAVELDLESGRALLARLAETIDAADASGLA
jgi:hypothetical protein